MWFGSVQKKQEYGNSFKNWYASIVVNTTILNNIGKVNQMLLVHYDEKDSRTPAVGNPSVAVFQRSGMGAGKIS